MYLCWGHFGLFLDSDWDHRGLKCVILSPFWMGDRIMNGVGTGIYCHSNLILIIWNNARKSATVSKLFWVVSGLSWGP